MNEKHNCNGDRCTVCDRGRVYQARKFCPHCPATEAEGHREYCPRYTGPIAEVELEGFKTFKDFSQHLCMQIIGLGQDIAGQDTETFGKRLYSLQESSHYFLLLYGTGEPGPDVAGILTGIEPHEPPADYGEDGLAGCSVCKALVCKYEHNPAGSMPGDVSK